LGRGGREQGSKGAREQGKKGKREKGDKIAAVTSKIGQYRDRSRIKACLAAFLVAVIASASAQSAPTISSSTPSTSLHSLAEAGIFTLGPVGYAAQTSVEETQFKSIFSHDSAKAKLELERLYSSGNPQAMAYALVGMRELDRKRYAEMLSAARTSHVTVTTMFGCVIEGEKLREIANDLDSGKYDLLLRWMASTLAARKS
jgi:hypothetical protein